MKENYIPAVGVHEILTRPPLNRWWMALVQQANPRYGGGSTQGYYVLKGDTGLLWDNYPPRLAQFLDRGVATARASAGTSAAVSAPAASATAPMEPPPGTSILRLYTRIRPLPADAGPMNALLGRDYMWVLREEVREMVTASDRGAGPFPLPNTLLARLITFHLVDNVRGQVWPWQPRSVHTAAITARVVRTSGTVRTLSLSGRFAKRDANPPHWTDRGHEGTLEGEVDIDTTALKITRMRAFSDATAWIEGALNRVTSAPPGHYPVKTAIVEATDDLARRVTPEQAGSGDYYLRSRIGGG